MKIEVVTIFPGMFSRVFEYGIIQRALREDLLQIEIIDLRQFAFDRHRSVDDRPFGGGEGMVLKPEPIFGAVEALKGRATSPPRVILLSPQGARFDQRKAQQLVEVDHLVLICGRYEGVDQRVAAHLVDEELSVGDFVLSGGEFAALQVIDSVARLVPGVVGNPNSLLKESFVSGYLDCPHYTRPANFRGWRVPEVLISGDHERVKQWRQKQAFRRTQRLRPDLLASGIEAGARLIDSE